MLTLYEFGNSVCCQKVRLTLNLKGLDWSSVQVNLFKSEQYDQKYLKLNPKGVVPTLLHDDRAIVESTLICEYLDEFFPQNKLVPDDPYLKAQMRLWSKMVDEGLHEGISEISFSAMFREKMKHMSEEQREIRFRNVGDPKRYDRFKSTYDLGVNSRFVIYAIAAYEKAFSQLEKSLSDEKSWILGDHFSLADINLIPYVARLNYLQLLQIWIKDRPFIQSWWKRVQLIPEFSTSISNPMLDSELEDMKYFGNLIAPAILKLRDELSSAQKL
jgi:ganglioside-induced differentiation-associated protein 1